MLQSRSANLVRRGQEPGRGLGHGSEAQAAVAKVWRSKSTCQMCQSETVHTSILSLPPQLTQTQPLSRQDKVGPRFCSPQDQFGGWCGAHGRLVQRSV